MTIKSGFFSYYDIFGVLAPGTVFLAALLLLFGDLESARLIEGVSVGGLGVLAILGYAAGHLVQAVGNVLEKLYWRPWGGMPSDWVRTGKHGRLPFSEAQMEKLREVCSSKLGLSIEGSIQELSAEEWDGITSQIKAAIKAEERAGRVSTFNSKYGFHRGLTASLLMVAPAALLTNRIWIGVASVLCVLVTGYRMHRFARHYARELFVQALQLANKE